MTPLRSRVVFDTTVACRDQSHEGLPPGEELAQVITGALRAAAVEVGELDATRWSWSWTVRLDGVALSVDLAEQAGWAPPSWPRWVIVLEEPGSGGVLGRLLGGAPTAARASAFSRLQRLLHAVLTSDPRFLAPRWLSAAEWRPGSDATGAAEP